MSRLTSNEAPGLSGATRRDAALLNFRAAGNLNPMVDEMRAAMKQGRRPADRHLHEAHARFFQDLHCLATWHPGGVMDLADRAQREVLTWSKGKVHAFSPLQVEQREMVAGRLIDLVSQAVRALNMFAHDNLPLFRAVAEQRPEWPLMASLNAESLGQRKRAKSDEQTTVLEGTVKTTLRDLNVGAKCGERVQQLEGRGKKVLRFVQSWNRLALKRKDELAIWVARRANGMFPNPECPTESKWAARVGALPYHFNSGSANQWARLAWDILEAALRKKPGRFERFFERLKRPAQNEKKTRDETITRVKRIVKRDEVTDYERILCRSAKRDFRKAIKAIAA